MYVIIHMKKKLADMIYIFGEPAAERGGQSDWRWDLFIYLTLERLFFLLKYLIFSIWKVLLIGTDI